MKYLLETRVIRPLKWTFFGALALALAAASEIVLAVLAAFSVTRCMPDATESAALSLNALAMSPMLKFMPLRVASVIFCTSSAWMVAPSALEFWSSQDRKSVV